MNRAKLSKTIIPAIAGLCLAACGGESETSSPTVNPAKPIKTVETNQVEKPVKPVAIEVSSEEALLKRGRIVWFKCRSCHETSVDGPHKVGPNLHGLMGAEAGVKEGYVYSDALKDSGVTWNDETLDAFIEKPSSYLKGTKMAFVGVRKESDRKALLAYIKENTKPAE